MFPNLVLGGTFQLLKARNVDCLAGSKYMDCVQVHKDRTGTVLYDLFNIENLVFIILVFSIYEPSMVLVSNKQNLAFPCRIFSQLCYYSDLVSFQVVVSEN